MGEATATTSKQTMKATIDCGYVSNVGRLI
jgi:hypothetical protein